MNIIGIPTEQSTAVTDLILAALAIVGALSVYAKGAQADRFRARIWSAEVAAGVPTRQLRLFAGAGVLDEGELQDLTEKADLPGAMKMQAGTLADMDLVARRIADG